MKGLKGQGAGRASPDRVDPLQGARYRPLPMGRQQIPAGPRVHVYHASCWVLALVAFSQLLLVGIALAVRENPAREPKVVERVVTEYIQVPVSPEGDQEAPRVPEPLDVAVPPAVVPPAAEAEEWNGEPLGLNRPPIADPEVEALVEGAQGARVEQDLARAVTKLFAAEKLAPADPNVLYELAQVYELAGNFDKAGDYYQKVLSLGVLGAGSLYPQAARKLRDGFGSPGRQLDRLSLGRIIEFRDSRVTDGQKIVLTVPVLAAPGQVKNPEGVELRVFLYDKVGEEIMAAPDDQSEQAWVSAPVDFRQGEEKTRVTYFIPGAAPKEQHLFGGRQYFGHVVALYQDGELIDQKAWPRTLATKVNARESNPLSLPEEYLPEDLNPGNPLQSPLPR